MNLGIGLIPLICRKRRQQQKKKNESDSPRTREDNEDSENGHHNNNYVDESPGEQKGSMIRIEVDGLSKNPVVIGRQKLLMSFCAACNIDLAKANRQTSPHLETCRWATKALSREMLRFSDVGMQIRGKHAVVLVNSKKVMSTAQVNDDHTGDINNHSILNQNTKMSQKDEWSANPVKIVPGDVISFEPRGGQGLCSRLEFSVVTLDYRMENEKVSTIAKKNDVNIITNGSIMGTVDLEKHDKGGQVKNDAFIDNSSRQAVFGGNCKTLKVTETNNSMKMAKSSFLVHFFPFGNGTYVKCSFLSKCERCLNSSASTFADRRKWNRCSMLDSLLFNLVAVHDLIFLETYARFNRYQVFRHPVVKSSNRTLASWERPL